LQVQFELDFMQRILFVCCFCLFVCFQLSAQPYVPFPTDQTTWTVVEQGFGLPTPLPGVSHFGTDGDTLIGGVLYTKLYANQGGLNVPNPHPAFDRAAATYFGAYREDSSRRVWFRGWANAADELRYDFGLAVGDTFCFANQPSGVLCHPVVAIDSILVGPAYRRRLNFAYNGQTESWIEGIGATVSGWDGAWSFVGNIEWALNCFHTTPNVTFGTCDFPVGLTPPLTAVLGIGPQPAGNYLVVQAMPQRAWQLELYHMDGRLALQMQGKGSVEVPIVTLPPGLYAYRLHGEDSAPRQGKLLKD
jgi:hypothetical protein